MPAPDPPRPARRTFQGPKGTRDFYPPELLRRRYIEKAWRDTSIRHGFEEIEGPTIEQAELYAVKSGAGILGEMFNVFSGKDPAEVAAVRESGRAPLALRPEFTPTLARMYAARARQLPAPTKWFTAGPYFRAEKPQRGRLREFCQWNCDIIGGTNEPEAITQLDLDVVGSCAGAFHVLGTTPSDFRVHLNWRDVTRAALELCGVPEEHHADWFQLLDRVPRTDFITYIAAASQIGADQPTARLIRTTLSGHSRASDQHSLGGIVQALSSFMEEVNRSVSNDSQRQQLKQRADQANARLDAVLQAVSRLPEFTPVHPLFGWMQFDENIVRGLAYYTGMVFEVIAEGERAVCGGGRYDNLIELFGGPPTPAVGFGMGDVVLGNLLADKGLMPEGPALLGALSAPPASLRPDVFVIANEKEESQKALRPLVSRLRLGVESPAWREKPDRKPWDRERYSAPPLHARHSYKATRNIGKLLQEASGQHARFAAIIESADDPAKWGDIPGGECTLKNLDTREEWKGVPLKDIAGRAANRG